MRPPNPASRASSKGLERACAWLATLVPLVTTLCRAELTGDFRGDLPLVTGLGLLPIGNEGWPGLVLAHAASLVPLGGRAERVAWVGALAAALSARLVFGLARRALVAAEATRLAPPLALSAALTAVLAPSFQLEATAAGGAALAAALALLALTAADRLPHGDARSSLVVGALAGLTVAESHTAGLALVVAVGVLAVARRRVPETRELVAGFAGAALVVALFFVTLLLRSRSPYAWLDLGLGLGQSSLSARETASERVTAYAAWLSEIGLLPFALSVLGTAFGVILPKARPVVLPLVALGLFDLALPASHVGRLTPDPFGPTRLLALASLGVGAALGVQAAALGLTRARVPFAAPAAALLVVFDFTLVFVGSEASAAATERRESTASEVWTDESFRSIPPSGLLLARSEALAWRLWSAQLLRGERPDVLVVPATLLERGALRRRLLDAEPALAPLLRDLALGGKPSEYALTSLADARALFVELDASWDERLNEHVV
ncbi:MAG TPA: hypothetical protein VGQ57_12925, partial [Polyangiaceae bacterium]|nr:hypothetical protein [Polyangiaceae bacterium]